ncbi:MAG: hypothetical protein MUC60_00570 [Oscillatoria sp. Prado101]|nr:hypothetical protein [Oscillatoria sp. Prado101]
MPTALHARVKTAVSRGCDTANYSSLLLAMDESKNARTLYCARCHNRLASKQAETTRLSESLTD